MYRSGVLKYASSNSFGIIADLNSKLIYLKQAFLQIFIRVALKLILIRKPMLFQAKQSYFIQPTSSL